MRKSHAQNSRKPREKKQEMTNLLVVRVGVGVDHRLLLDHGVVRQPVLVVLGQLRLGVRELPRQRPDLARLQLDGAERHAQRQAPLGLAQQGHALNGFKLAGALGVHLLEQRLQGRVARP